MTSSRDEVIFVSGHPVPVRTMADARTDAIDDAGASRSGLRDDAAFQDPANGSYGQGHLYMYGSLTEGVRQWKGTGYYAGNSYEFHEDDNLANAQPPA